MYVCKDHNALKSQVLHSSTEISVNNKAINELEQYSRRDCIEIQGIPYTPDESTDNIVEKVGELTGVDIKGDISISHRLQDKVITRSDGSQFKCDPAIIVKFTKRSTRDDFYYSRKKLHQQSTSNFGYVRQHEQPTFICKTLTATNHKLFNRCLDFKKKLFYKFIWTH